MQTSEIRLSIIVPVFNMGGYALPLIESLKDSAFFVAEVVFVDDGSTDDSLSRMRSLGTDKHGIKIRVVDLGKNRGRFEAIKRGVEAAESDLVCISNIRTEYTKSSFEAAQGFLKNHRALMPHVYIDEKKSIYSLYWKRTHEWLFRKNFADAKAGFRIDSENFEDYTKGTGGFICPKQEYLNACDSLPVDDPSSDDIFLLRYFAEKMGIYVQESYYISWEPRQTLKDFLFRMWERGPGFVEYNFLHQKGRYWKFFQACIWSLGSILLLVIIWPSLWLPLLATGLIIGLGGILYQSQRFSRGIFETLKLFPLHAGVGLFFAAGVFYGLVFHTGLVKKPEPVGASK